MGQIFNACAYDIENRICCVFDADKFHANCYSFSGTIFSMHYLLRQKAYHIMWGGNYVALCDHLENFSETEVLLGLSTYLNYEDFKENNDDLESKSCHSKAKFIGDNHGLWKRIDIWDKASEYFNYEETRSVKYDGYLLNHTKKLAIDLADYHKRSKYLLNGIESAIDAVPILTETGDGTPMALFDGLSANSTEELAGEWCGNLLQIVDELPEGYQLTDCCFAGIWSRADYCYHTFGINDDGFILGDSNGKLFEASEMSIRGKRKPFRDNVKIEINGDKTKFVTVPIN